MCCFSDNFFLRVKCWTPPTSRYKQLIFTFQAKFATNEKAWRCHLRNVTEKRYTYDCVVSDKRLRWFLSQFVKSNPCLVSSAFSAREGEESKIQGLRGHRHGTTGKSERNHYQCNNSRLSNGKATLRTCWLPRTQRLHQGLFSCRKNQNRSRHDEASTRLTFTAKTPVERPFSKQIMPR